jgi:Zn-finger nucleic acid-binding protein
MDPYRQPEPPEGDDCPRCKGRLVGVSRGRLHHRTCSGCRGIWIREEALEKAINDARIRRLLDRDPGGRWLDDGTCLDCIVCGEAMRRTTVSTEPRVIIDVCEHGIWLDRGELETIVRAFPPGSDPLATPEGKPDSAWVIVLSAIFDAIRGALTLP